MTDDLNISVVSVTELCQLIRACAQNGIKEFRLGTFHLAFGEVDPLPYVTESVKTKPSAQQIEKINEEVLIKESEIRLAEELENLRLTDPLAYERLIEGESNVGGTT